ncbi:MAG: 30S ribosomal protein S12 methylthiotransferase RimO [Phycisphaerales bacterium]|jgi:ribosomal protein S12 methylthiotransferase|nr:30S ribosomal protein S12 methylthiotransferase RimO [Phycisphaerales bacterium]
MRDTPIQKIAFVSLGCPKNLVDSEQMIAAVLDAGYELIANHHEADAIIINTCGFLEAAKDESVEVINEAIALKDTANVQRVVAAGCLVQRHRAKLLQWCPSIDAMIGVFDRDHIVDALSAVPTTENAPSWISANALLAARARGENATAGYTQDDANRFQLTPRHWAYLRVSEGCNQNCAFCTIPAIRGKMRSKPLETIVAEAKKLIASGVVELNLIGQDTTSYGEDLGYKEGLVGLLTELNSVVADTGGGWIRLMYAYPSNFSEEMIHAVASLPHVVNYIDMPLQHASNSMLAAMKRNVTSEHQVAVLESLRNKMPEIAVRTTLITGFPGETEEDHHALLSFVRAQQFEALGVFQYSAEEGTVAGTLEKDTALRVSEATKQAREEELMLLQQSIAFETAARRAQQEVRYDVLIDAHRGQTAEGALQVYKGRTHQQAPDVDACTIVLAEKELVVGEIIRCTIIDSDQYDMVARPTIELEKVVSLPLR